MMEKKKTLLLHPKCVEVLGAQILVLDVVLYLDILQTAKMPTIKQPHTVYPPFLCNFILLAYKCRAAISSRKLPHS